MSAKVQIFTVFLSKHMFVLLILVFLKYFLFLNAIYRKEISLETLTFPQCCYVPQFTKDYWELRIFFYMANFLDSHALSMKLTMLLTVNIYSFCFDD